MKGKVNFYYNAPNTARIRTRLQNPSKELTSKLREAVQEAIVEVVNEQTVAIRAKLITKFAALGEVAKDEKSAAALTSVLNSFFDVFASTDKNAWNDEETEQAEEADAEQAEEADAEQAEEAEQPEQVEGTTVGDDSFED